MSEQPIEQRPEITVTMLKEAGLTCYFREFMGKIGSQFIEKGYSFNEFREAVWKYCYYSADPDGGLYARLRPSFDPDAKPCPECNDPEIVMQPQEDGWRCPKCKKCWAE